MRLWEFTRLPGSAFSGNASIELVLRHISIEPTSGLKILCVYSSAIYTKSNNHTLTPIYSRNRQIRQALDAVCRTDAEHVVTGHA